MQHCHRCSNTCMHQLHCVPFASHSIMRNSRLRRPCGASLSPVRHSELGQNTHGQILQDTSKSTQLSMLVSLHPATAPGCLGARSPGRGCRRHSSIRCRWHSCPCPPGRACCSGGRTQRLPCAQRRGQAPGAPTWLPHQVTGRAPTSTCMHSRAQGPGRDFQERMIQSTARPCQWRRLHLSRLMKTCAHTFHWTTGLR